MIFGSLAVFWASTAIVIFIPAATLDDKPSDQWRPMSAVEEEGLHEYVSNGCSYCHSLFVRTGDWDAQRIAKQGDYYQETPAIMGTERVGPDLSQEAGEHPDDWHTAHFSNPRYTRPMSLMPSWEFLGEHKLKVLTAYVQSQGGKNGDARVDRQVSWHSQTHPAWEKGPDYNIEWLHAHVPTPWRAMPNPYPATKGDLDRGQKIYQDFCINCHGPMGDGKGPAAKYLHPEPLNFTALRRHLVDNKYIGGILYYQIMNGVTGSAMPYFKSELESAKIWDVSNYIADRFIGYSDAGIEPRGIRAAYEPEWENTYKAPTTQEAGNAASSPATAPADGEKGDRHGIQPPSQSPFSREAPHESK
jgi:cbb3-type cytochrome oxidase cytochrome c subunit